MIYCCERAIRYRGEVWYGDFDDLRCPSLGIIDILWWVVVV